MSGERGKTAETPACRVSGEEHLRGGYSVVFLFFRGESSQLLSCFCHVRVCRAFEAFPEKVSGACSFFGKDKASVGCGGGESGERCGCRRVEVDCGR